MSRYDLTVSSTKKDVTLKITNTTEKKKAFNHSTIKDSKNKLPQRQFLPDDSDGEVFKRSIKLKVKEMIADASED